MATMFGNTYVKFHFYEFAKIFNYFNVNVLLDYFPLGAHMNIIDTNTVVHNLHECVPSFLLCVYLRYRIYFYSASVNYAKQFPMWVFKFTHPQQCKSLDCSTSCQCLSLTSVAYLFNFSHSAG